MRAFDRGRGHSACTTANGFGLEGALPLETPRRGHSSRCRRFCIALADGWLALDEIQRPGGKRMLASQFLAGTRGELPVSVGLA